jgi:membrane protease subunit (stomatin/prohibitin family)
MTKRIPAVMLAASFLVSCSAAPPTMGGTYECGVTCTVGGVAMGTSAPFQEMMEATDMDAVNACESQAQAQVMAICGDPTATVSCVCDLTM